MTGAKWHPAFRSSRDFFTYICMLNRSRGIEHLLAERPRDLRAQRSPITTYGSEKFLVMTSAYARKTIRTDVEGSGKKLSRVGRGMLDVYLAFHFGAKLTILGATNVFARTKNPY